MENIVFDDTINLMVGERIVNSLPFILAQKNCQRVIIVCDEPAFRLGYVDMVKRTHKRIGASFPVTMVYQAHIPTCPSGYWLFGFASKKYHPLKDLDAERWKGRHIKTWYYTTNLHMGAFMLPKYVEDLLEEEEGRSKHD